MTDRTKKSQTWTITWNNPEETLQEFQQNLEDWGASDWRVQTEIGETLETRHYQGTVRFKARKYFSTLKKYNDKIHWEPCRNFKKSWTYCTKESTATGEYIEHGGPPLPPSRKNPPRTPSRGKHHIHGSKKSWTWQRQYRMTGQYTGIGRKKDAEEKQQ